MSCKPNVFVCAKVFIFYNAVKPCEICATKAKYLNQCITPGKFERALPSPRITTINFFFPLHGIVVLIINMVRMYTETALPGSLPALFHDIFFNLSISTDKLETRLQPRFQRLHLFLFQLLGPLCTQRIKQNGADSKKRRFVNSIKECFYLNCSRVKLK